MITITARCLALFAALLCLIGSPNAANAALVTYDFRTTGPFSGAAGSFTYDDSIVPPGGGTVTGPGLFTNLTFPGYTGDTQSLEFDSDGNLVRAKFGCFNNSCVSPFVGICAPYGVCGHSSFWFAWPEVSPLYGMFGVVVVDAVDTAAVTMTRRVTEPLITPVLNPVNGHYYAAVVFPDPGLTWDAAKSSAESTFFMGNRGYLATITSKQENDFLIVHFASVRPPQSELWVGGSDAAVNGEWRWVVGPEAGTLFWLGGPSGTPLGFADWAGGEPNNSFGDESRLSWTELGWNDLPAAGFSSLRAGYIVEFDAARLVPGTLEAEAFDRGGEGLGYHDLTPGNQGDAGYRTSEDVDIFVSNDAAGGGRIVKNFESGEWLAYTISVPTGGNYTVDVRASTHPLFPRSAYHLEVDGTNVTSTIVLPDTGGWDNYQWLGARTLSLTAGTHVIKIVSEQPYFNLNSIRVSSTSTTVPYFGSPTAVPGEFEAEVFDRGGEGVAYHDGAPGNQGNSGFRDGEDVDIFITNDAASGSPYIVKNLQAGEWLAYSISVRVSGNYDFELRASTHPAFPDSAYHLEVDGTNVTGTVTLADTGDWDHYQWLGRRTVALTSGTHVLKLVVEQAYFNLNSMRLTTTGSTGATPTSVPGIVEAEEFDAGGDGVAYHDHTPGNQGDAGYRTSEDVDIFGSNDSGSGSWYIVKNFEAGEWLVYSISVPTSGNYAIDLRASTHPAFPNSAYHLEVDGVNVTGPVVLPDTGGWDNYQWVGQRTVALTAGLHTVTITSEQAYFNFNSFRVVHSP